MNLFNILSDIEQVDPEVYGRLDSRRAVFKHLGGLGQKLSAAALPLAVGAIFTKAYAQTPAGLTVVDILNFALRLEYLEATFYAQRGALSLAPAFSAALATIATDETNHVALLRNTIIALGGTPVAAPPAGTFDFTMGKGSNAGPFSGYATNLTVFLALAQSFEDLGVRTYKGAAPLPALMANKTVLTVSLGLHSVEARHAAQIRAMRRALATSSSTPPSQGIPQLSNLSAAPKSWISGTDNGGAAPTSTAPIYGAGIDTGAPTGVSFPAENNTTQAGLNLAALTSSFGVPASALSEAFDEGLDVGTVSVIARQFVVAGSTFF